MKIISDVALFAGCALFFCGCGKPKPAVQPVISPAAENSQGAIAVAPPVYQPTAAAAPVVATNPDGGADLRQLNHIYISWIVQNHRRPKTFEEFVSASGVQIPPASSGKKYVIDKNGFIALVNQ